MSSKFIGKKITNEAGLGLEEDAFLKTNTKTRAIKLEDPKYISNNFKKTKKNITQAYQNKKELINKIDNLLDYQSLAKKRVTQYLKEKKKAESEEKKKALSEEKRKKKEEKGIVIQEVPEFLEKTKMRLANYSQAVLIKKVEKKEELKRRMEKLEEIKKKAKIEIGKLPKRKFEPKETFMLSFEKKRELDEKEREIFNEEMPEQFEKNRNFMMNDKKASSSVDFIKKEKNYTKIGNKSNEKKSKQERNWKTINKSREIPPKDISKVMNEKRKIEKKKEEEKARELAILNRKNAKMMILERQIKEKEKEIAEYEEMRRNQLKPPDFKKNDSFEKIKNYEEEQKNFLKKINNKIHEDLEDFPSFDSEKYQSFLKENDDNEPQKNKEIEKFLKKTKSDKKNKKSPLDHMLFVNQIIEKNEKKKHQNHENENNKNEFDDFLGLEDFENDIYMFNNMYCPPKKECKPNINYHLPENNFFFDSNKENLPRENLAFNNNYKRPQFDEDFNSFDLFLDNVINGKPKELMEKKQLNFYFH